MAITSNPKRSCDIVMKGGITSGIVYPKAISRLSTRFTFRNIGGTSAGAIAAAVAAAAEHRRVRTGGSEGFTEIDGLGAKLAAKLGKSSKSMLFSLFTPNATTKRIFEVLTAPLGLKTRRQQIGAVLRRAVGQYFVAGILGTLPGIALALISLYWSPNTILTVLWVAVGILIGLAGGLIAVAASFVYEFVAKIPDNGYGLCNGMSDSKSSSARADVPLTVWLCKYLNEVAGIPNDKPLTFGDLWGPDGIETAELREVNLEMMTTNLTHGRPYRLPFRNDEDLRENHLFYFCKKEFDQLFPNTVVEWMLDNPRPILLGTDTDGKRADERKRRADDGYYPLPNPENLPVVVATRMSLSFPVLLSVIPLYAVDYAKGNENTELERCWFTDGGVCSNFPIHFFDSPLPRRPTFSIDLSSKPDDSGPEDLSPSMDGSNGFAPMDRWNRFDTETFATPGKKSIDKKSFGKLMGFAGTLISTMQNWNDATQGRLPGYRDRIARIPLTSEQGGLNLNMPDKLLDFLSRQGEHCADEMLSHFDVPAVHEVMTWDNHRWIRLRSMFAGFEKMVDSTLLACDQPENDDLGYEDWLKFLNPDPAKAPSYDPTRTQIAAALETITKLREIQQLWKRSNSAAAGSPRPRPELRPRAQI